MCSKNVFINPILKQEAQICLITNKKFVKILKEHTCQNIFNIELDIGHTRNKNCTKKQT